jgi:hypothetical protein
MTVGGDDDTLAGSTPTVTGTTSDVPELVANRYRIARWLGGGMGRVYEAIDTELNERVALKAPAGPLRGGARLPARSAPDAGYVKNVARMFTSAITQATLPDDGAVDGDSLEGARRADALAPLQLLAIQICEGLTLTRRRHRSSRPPDNILVERASITP